MSKYIVTKNTEMKHKKFISFMFITTYILFLPFVILAYVNDFLETIINFVASLRNRIVYGSVKVLFRKDCRKVEEDE